MKSNNIDDIRKRIQSLFLPHCKSLVFTECNDTSLTANVEFSDGKTSKIVARYSMKKKTKYAKTSWNPTHWISSDGEVYDSQGNFLGYFKLSKTRPREVQRIHNIDSIQIDLCDCNIDILNADSIQEIIHKCKHHSK